MVKNDIYKGFAPHKQEEYEREIASTYGKQVVQECEQMVKGWSKDEWGRVQAELTSIHEEIARHMAKGPGCPDVQAQIARHRDWLNRFYECGAERHLGVALQYATHPDFIESYKKFLGHEQGGEFMYQAVKIYCEKEKGIID